MNVECLDGVTYPSHRKQVNPEKLHEDCRQAEAEGIFALNQLAHNFLTIDDLSGYYIFQTGNDNIIYWVYSVCSHMRFRIFLHTRIS